MAYFQVILSTECDSFNKCFIECSLFDKKNKLVVYTFYNKYMYLLLRINIYFTNVLRTS